jgi:hypothetical protein
MSLAIGIGISTSVFIELPGGGSGSPTDLITEIGMTPPEDNIVTEAGVQIQAEA